jgi:phage terminase large subunit-like protein
MTPRAAELIRSNLVSFVRKAFAGLHPGELLGVQPYVSYLCYELSKLFEGDITRLIINLPPRHLKSFIGSVCFAAWWLAHRPSSKVMIVTYSEPLARNLGHRIQAILRSSWYQQLFPTRISANHSSVTDFSTIQGGGVYAVSFGGSITGYGGDLIIFDDPLNISDAGNEQQLQRVNDGFDPLVMSRLNHPKTDPVVIIAHRLAENDLAGFLLQQGGWERVVLPFVATQDATYGAWHRRKGELLRPEAYGEHEVARIKAGGSYETLYQQCVGAEEQRITPDHFGRYRGYEVPMLRAVVLSVDASQCSGPKNSFSVIQAWWYSGEDHYLLDQWRSQCDYEELWRAYSVFCKRYNPSAALIERAANGYALIRDSKRRRRRLRVAEIATDRRSKTARLVPHLETIRAGRIKLPRDADFVDNYIAEFAASKRTTFDQVDATTQYLEWIAKQPPLLVPPPRAVAVARNPSGPIMPDRNTFGHVLVTKRRR